jgi:hypothetical protein
VQKLQKPAESLAAFHSTDGKEKSAERSTFGTGATLISFYLGDRVGTSPSDSGVVHPSAVADGSAVLWRFARDAERLP